MPHGDRGAQLFRCLVSVAVGRGVHGLLHGRDDLTRGAKRVFIAVQPKGSARPAETLRRPRCARRCGYACARDRRRRQGSAGDAGPKSSKELSARKSHLAACLLVTRERSSGLNRAVHVSLDFGNGERPVVQADFVDAAREEFAPDAVAPHAQHAGRREQRVRRSHSTPT